MVKNTVTSRIYIIAAIGLMMMVFLSAAIPQTERSVYSTSSSNPLGTKAFFLLLEQEGQKVARLAGLVPADNGLVILLEPSGLTTENRAGLLEWVSQGNTVLLAGEKPNLLYQHFGYKPEVTAARPGVYAVSSEHQLLKDVHELYFPGKVRLKGQTAADFAYSDEHGIYLSEHFHGKGRVIFLTAPDLLANAHISEKDNLILFLNIVRLYAQNGIWFSEGSEGGKPGAAHQERFVGPLTLAGVQLGLGVLLLYYFWGRRFGRIIPGSRAEEQITGNYISSLAIIYRQARARHLIFESIYLGFKEDLTRYLGVPANTSHDELVKIFSGRPHIDGQRLGNLLAYCEQILTRPGLSENDLLTIGRDLEMWREANLSSKAKRGKDDV